MTTTTLALIRKNYCGSQTTRGVLEAITPSYSTDKPFARSRANKPLREWATGTSSAAFRQFEWYRTGDAADPNVLDPAERLTIERVTITIAYPELPMLYGPDVESIEDAIRADAKQLRDALLSPGNLIAGCQCVMPTIRPPERGLAIWFQDIDCEVTYFESQTLT